MKEFDKYVENSQTNWREKNISGKEHGVQNGKKYPWILPRKMWEQGLWPGIRSDSPHSLPEYLVQNDVQKHDGVHNLKSSWMLCAI